MDSKSIRKLTENFENAVKQMIFRINDSSDLWKDQQFTNLSNSISEVAFQAKTFMECGDRFCESIDSFSKIAEEEY